MAIWNDTIRNLQKAVKRANMAIILGGVAIFLILLLPLLLVMIPLWLGAPKRSLNQPSESPATQSNSPPLPPSFPPHGAYLRQSLHPSDQACPMKSALSSSCRQRHSMPQSVLAGCASSYQGWLGRSSSSIFLHNDIGQTPPFKDETNPPQNSDNPEASNLNQMPLGGRSAPPCCASSFVCEVSYEETFIPCDEKGRPIGKTQ